MKIYKHPRKSDLILLMIPNDNRKGQFYGFPYFRSLMKQDKGKWLRYGISDPIDYYNEEHFKKMEYLGDTESDWIFGYEPGTHNINNSYLIEKKRK